MIGREVIAAIDDALPAKVLGRDEVGVLAHRQIRKARALGQIVPVVALFAELAFEGEHHDHGAQRFEFTQCGEIVRRKLRGEAGHQPRRDGADDLVENLRLAAFEMDRPCPRLAVEIQAFDGGAVGDLSAARFDLGGEVTEEGLETPDIGAEPAGAGLDPGPEPGHVHLPGVRAELADQQRLEQEFVGALAHPA